MMRQVKWLDKYPIAHRGYYDETHPENSLAAFEEAVKHNYAIELDLQLSKDLQLVVFHDDDLARMCQVEGGVKDYTYQQLQTFKLAKTNHSMPLFADVLKLVKGRVPLVIELKSIKEMNALLCPKVYQMLQDYQGDYVIQSFNPFLVKYFKIHHPEILRGQLVCDMVDSNFNKIIKVALARLWLNIFSKPDFINSHFTYLPPKLLRFKKRGGQTICYTARNEQEYRQAFKDFDNVIFEQFEPKYFYQK